jgi:nitroimidazol reductase NimA-like FMN-containing flavoprotein (pyridoxamine 5'-phosphate oxidase superfamily)
MTDESRVVQRSVLQHNPDRTSTIGVIVDEPITELDERFSEPDTQPTSWERTREVLETAQLAWVSTVRADGRPHVTPLVAVWLDGALHFSTGATEQKGVNLATNPNVVLTTGCNQWDQRLDVMVEGQARRVTDRATLERLAKAWATKWDGFWQYEVTDDGFRQPDPTSDPSEASAVHSAVFSVEPSKILAFGKRPFTHTRHVPSSG